MTSSASRCSLALAVAMACSALGCQSFNGAGGWFSLGREKPNMHLQTATLGKYSVEFYEKGKKPLRKEFPITGPVFVQNALDQSGAKKRFSRMTIQLVRSAPGQAKPLKMEVAYDRSSGRVDLTHDYALHPGDRLMIKKDTSNSIDDMLGGVLGAASFSRR